MLGTPQKRVTFGTYATISVTTGAVPRGGKFWGPGLHRPSRQVQARSFYPTPAGPRPFPPRLRLDLEQSAWKTGGEVSGGHCRAILPALGAIPNLLGAWNPTNSMCQLWASRVFEPLFFSGVLVGCFWWVFYGYNGAIGAVMGTEVTRIFLHRKPSFGAADRRATKLRGALAGSVDPPCPVAVPGRTQAAAAPAGLGAEVQCTVRSGDLAPSLDPQTDSFPTSPQLAQAGLILVLPWATTHRSVVSW